MRVALMAGLWGRCSVGGWAGRLAAPLDLHLVASLAALKVVQSAGLSADPLVEPTEDQTVDRWAVTWAEQMAAKRVEQWDGSSAELTAVH